MSQLKAWLDQALVKGESLKSELLSEVFDSKVVKELLKSDLFAKAVTTVIKKKDEITEVILTNIKNVMHVMDVPSKKDLKNLSYKVDSLEKAIDRVGRKAITAKSLRTINKRKKK